MDNLFNLINKEDEENLLTNVDPADEEDTELIREKSYAKNTQVIFSSVTKDQTGSKINFNNYDDQDKLLNSLKQIAKTSENAAENYNVCKYLDFNNCYKENFYENIFK